MKNILQQSLITAFILLSINSFAQFGVNYHFSGESLLSFNYEIDERILPEIRIGVNRSFDDIAVEPVITYQFINSENFEFYAGAGLRANNDTGIVLPVGLHLYPFEEKNFGFLIELSPMILDDFDYVRGSFGARYRFWD